MVIMSHTRHLSHVNRPFEPISGVYFFINFLLCQYIPSSFCVIVNILKRCVVHVLLLFEARPISTGGTFCCHLPKVG